MPRALTAVLQDMRAMGLHLELEPDPWDSLEEEAADFRDYVPTEMCQAQGVNGEPMPISERPTIPAPSSRESGVRLKAKPTELAFAIVDAVVCDLTHDPRFER